MLAKSLTFLAGADAAGIVVGARVPIILTSRADSLMARLASCAVAVLVAQGAARGRARPWGDAMADVHPGAQRRLVEPQVQRLRRRRRAAHAAAHGPDRGHRHGAAPSSPRAPPGDGARRERRWDKATALDHDAAIARPDRLACRAIAADSRLVAVGHRVVHGGTDFARAGAHRPEVIAALASSCPLAPLHQPHNLAADRASPSCAPSCRRSPASTPPSTGRSPRWRRPSPCRRRSPTPACAATASTACPTSTSPRACRQLDPEAGGRPHRRRAPRQRRQPVRDRARAQRRQHDGLHRGRRPADGHALRRARSRRRPLPDGQAGHGRAGRSRRCSTAVRPARRLRPVESDMRDAAGEPRSRARARGRPVRATASAASSARSPPRWAAWTRSSSPPASASTPRRSASASVATRPGSA